MIRNVAGSARVHKLGGADCKMDHTQHVYRYEQLHRAKSITDSVQLEGVLQDIQQSVKPQVSSFTFRGYPRLESSLKTGRTKVPYSQRTPLPELCHRSALRLVFIFFVTDNPQPDKSDRYSTTRYPSSHTMTRSTSADHVNHLITVRVRRKPSNTQRPRQLPNQPPFLTLTLKSHNHRRATRQEKNKEHMAQGKVKGMKTSKQKATRPASSSSTTKKGKRYVAPKKADAIKLASLKRVRIRIFFVYTPFFSPFPISLLGEGSTGIGSESASYTGPQRKDQSFDRTAHRRRRLIWEAHDHEKRWL